MTAAHVLLVLAIAWGAFAFGAVYAWAYWPLCGALAICALAGLAARRSTLRLGELTRLFFAVALFAAAALVQAIPLPLDWLPNLSPAAPSLLSELDLRVATGAVTDHPISVSPRHTLTGVALFATFALTAAGVARLVSARGPRSLAEAVTAIGVVMAIVAVVQQSVSAEKIYGFWTPQVGRNPFGPFVNKNHFAGWMLMAIPLTLGLLGGGIARGMQHVKPTFRDRVIWFASPSASRLVLLSVAAIVMSLALVMTMSRSGITALVVAVSVTSLVAVKRQHTAARKTILVAYLTVLVVAVFGWVGLDVIVSRFESADWSEFNNRRGAWVDAWRIATNFPWTGTGLNTYGVATLFYQQSDLDHHYVQAHNDYLQLAAEGGLLLAVPALLSIAALASIVRQRFRDETSVSSYWLRVGAVTGLAAIALQEVVEFSLQMPGNATLFAVLCGIAMHRAAPRTAARAHHATVSRMPIREHSSISRANDMGSVA